jgi:hypothetical protein
MIKRRWPWPINRSRDEDDNAIFIVGAFIGAGILLFLLIAIF